ncbi:MAG: hypothetical protein RLZZ58_1599 [Pseudomonadota bacterium]
MTRRWIGPLIAGAVMVPLAWQATLLATPYALMAAAMQKIGSGGPVNSFAFGAPATAANQPIVRPSPDLLYASCVFDVSGGPVIVEAQAVPDTYWSISIFDARTDVAAVRSARDTGGASAKLALFRAGQRPPVGYDPVRLNHDKGIALIRVLADPRIDKSAFDAIDRARRTSSCRPANSAN